MSPVKREKMRVLVLCLMIAAAMAFAPARSLKASTARAMVSVFFCYKIVEEIDIVQ